MVAKAHLCSSNMRSSYPLVTSSLLTIVGIPTCSLLYAEEETKHSVWSCRSQRKRYPEQNSSRTPFSLVPLLSTDLANRVSAIFKPTRSIERFFEFAIPYSVGWASDGKFLLIARLYSLINASFRLEWIHICMLSSVPTSCSTSH